MQVGSCHALYLFAGVALMKYQRGGGGAQTAELCVPRVLEAGCSRFRWQQDPFPLRALPSACLWLPLAMSSHGLSCVCVSGLFSSSYKDTSHSWIRRAKGASVISSAIKI